MRLFGPGLPGRGPNNALPLRRPVAEAVAPGVAFELIPGAKGEVLYPGYGDVPDRVVRYAINADGFRDVPFARPKPAGVYRIALVGDSVVYGTGVALEHTLSRQLEGVIADRIGPGKIEVLNCGVYAYNLRQEVGLLAHRVLAFEPDMVILVAAINDASGPGLERSEESDPWEARWIRRLGLASGVWEPEEVAARPAAMRHMNTLRRTSRVVDRVAHVAFNALFARAKAKSYTADWAPGSPGHEGVREALAGAKQLATRHDFALRCVMYPSLNGSLGGDFDGHGVTETLRTLCTDLAIPFVDLYPAFAGQAVEPLRAHPHDRHPNRIGHALAAHHLLEALLPQDTSDISPSHWRFLIPRPGL